MWPRHPVLVEMLETAETRRTVRCAGGPLSRSFCIGAHTRCFAVGEELHANQIRITAHRAIFDISLLAAASLVQRDHDPLATGRADIAGLIPGPRALSFAAFHPQVF
jgi:hypothetical protein